MKAILITIGALAAAAIAASPLTGQFASDVMTNELRFDSLQHERQIRLGDLPSAPSLSLRVSFGKGEVGQGELILDPNTCTLDSFGDGDLCTDMAPTTIPVTLHRLRLEDPWGIGRTLYELEGLPPDTPVRLVVPPLGPIGGYRLVCLAESGGLDKVVLLERVQ